MTDSDPLTVEEETNEVVPQMWDLQTKPFVSNVTQRYVYKDKTVQNFAEGTTFLIEHTSSGEYVAPHDSFLEFSITITDRDTGLGYGVGDDVALDQGCMGVFSKATLSIGGHLLSTVNNPGLLQFLECLATWSSDRTKNGLTEGIAPYSAEQSWNANPSVENYTANKVENYSYARMSTVTQDAQVMTYRLSLGEIFSFLKINDHVTKGVDVSLELTRNPRFNENVVSRGIGPITRRFLINFTGIKVSWATAEPTAEFGLLLKDELSSNDQGLVAWTEMQDFKSILIQNAATSVSMTINPTRGKPKFIYVIVQRATAYNNQDSSSRLFGNKQGIRIVSLQAEMDSQTYPKQILTLQPGISQVGTGLFTAVLGNVADAYGYYLKAHGNPHNEKEGSLLKVEDWKEAYMLFYLPFITDNVYDSSASYPIVLTVGVDSNVGVVDGYYISGYVGVEHQAAKTLKGGKTVFSQFNPVL